MRKCNARKKVVRAVKQREKKKAIRLKKLQKKLSKNGSNN